MASKRNKWHEDEGIDVALDAVRRIAKASGAESVVLHVRVDGRVEIEVRDAGRRFRSKSGRADLDQDGSTLPEPSEMLMMLIDALEASRGLDG